jgi:hypothetical protein
MLQAVKPPTDRPYPDELLDLFDRANRGDAGDVQALRAAFDRYPELVAELGDLARHAEKAIVALAAGPSVTGREAITRHLAAMRSRLCGPDCPDLERLLADRVVLCWAEAHHGDIDVVGRQMRGAGADPAAAAALKRLDRAHARFLSASKALATVRRLLRPSPSPLEIAMKPVAESPPARPAFSRARTPATVN